MPGEKNKQSTDPFFECISCNYSTSNKKYYNRHIMTPKHTKSLKGELLENNLSRTENSLSEKIPSKYHCSHCNYNTNKHSNFVIHETSKKHIARLNNTTDENKNQCSICNKIYSKSSNLWKHKKLCQVLENKNELTNEFREPDVKKPEITIELFMDLMKQNKELQNCLMESHTKIVELSQNSGTNNSHNNNNNNNQFNVQFFLNETCKDAMNIQDFINSLQLTTKDFENTGKVGFIDGISQIIINKLNSVDTTERPMHCTDSKRETMYIKDDNVWNKEDDSKTKFKRVVNQIANKNLQQLTQWKQENPDCITLDTKENIEYRQYYKAALGARTNEEHDKFFEKIKRNVLKEIVVNKSV